MESSRSAAPAVLLAAGLALLGPASGRPQADGQKPTFPAEAEIVTVDVVVTDRAGEPVLDLRREDFTVTEDGVSQPITAFEVVIRPAPDATAATAAAAPVEPRSSSNRGPGPRLGSHFVIVFDELHLGLAEAVRARRAVADFLATGVADGDRVALVGTAEGTRWTARLPEGRAALLRALDRLQPRLLNEAVRDRMSDFEAMRIDRDRDPQVTDVVMRRYLDTGEIQQDTASPGNPALPQSQQVESWRDQVLSRAAGVYARATARNEQALGVVSRALEALAAERGRKSLVFASGGMVQDPRLAIYRQVVNEARRVNAAVYFLDARGLSGAQAGLEGEIGTRTEFRDLGSWFTEARERGEGSEALAADTGGFSLRDRNDLAAGLARIGRESRGYYLLGYAPSNRKADGRFRTIEVRVAREGARVRARRGYYAPGASEGRPKGVEGSDAAMQRALDAPFDLADVPLRAIADVLGPAEAGKATVRLTVEADIRGFAFAEKGGLSRDTLELLLLVARDDTGEFSRFDQQFEMNLRPETRARYEKDGFSIAREVPLAPGRYQARIVARDRNGGAVGSLLHAFEVPDLAGLRVSSLLLTDRLADAAKGAAPAPQPTARRQFAPSGTLHCRFEVYGASADAATGQPKVAAGFSIRRSDGKFLAAMPETPLQPAPDGTLARALGVPLGGAPPGRYEAIVVVTDLVAGRAAEAREPFEIGAER
ncbi:MAG TPA: VWA domain-containing protein [Vicinamibacteria bacterium]|nr:VWA domain-containing protein [Vicinamibacteria bacterium]